MPTADETTAIWNRNAAFWDAQMGDGNLFVNRLLRPALAELLRPRAGQRMLEVACGNGVFARWLADQGAEVVACDVSEQFIGLAKAREKVAGRIDYRVIDATRSEQLRSLGEHRYDAVLCVMALMDIPDIDPLLAEVPRLLAKGGAFVFAIQHPCFNSNAMSMLIEQEDRGGKLVTRYSLRLSDYLHIPAGRGIGIPGQPEPHHYFHRPLADVLGRCFRQGLVVDGLLEPALEDMHDDARGTSWVNYGQFPPVLVVRLRTAG
jgi:SAM-dependent methyltransferase